MGTSSASTDSVISSSWESLSRGRTGMDSGRPTERPNEARRTARASLTSAFPSYSCSASRKTSSLLCCFQVLRSCNFPGFRTPFTSCVPFLQIEHRQCFLFFPPAMRLNKQDNLLSVREDFV